MKEKFKALQKLQEFITWVQRQAGQNVKRFWSNNGGEYDSKSSQAWFKETRI